MGFSLFNIFFKNLIVISTFIVSIICPAIATASESWVPVKDVSLLIEPNSILDFSKIIPSENAIDTRLIINKSGHFAKESSPDKPIKFLIGALSFGVQTGGIPSHEMIDLYVKQYRLHGYNMARLDFLEAILMESRKQDFDYNPEQLDRFYYLVAALKRNGMYLILNGLSNGNGGYGNVDERWLGKKGLHQRLYFEAEAQAHWKKLISTMYGAVNPYTGMTILKDPVLAGVILVNENNLVFVNRPEVLTSSKPYFSQWLKTKYGNQYALKKAWGNELAAEENIDLNQINFPKTDAWTSRRMADTQQFYNETEKKTADWMTQYLRQQGFKGQVTSYNFWHAPAAQATRGQFDWVDMHNYFAAPEYLSANRTRVRQDSMLKDGAGYVRELAAAKHISKAYTVTEHGQIFWNEYRRENGLALPAYAALQSWDGICQHSHAINLSYAEYAGDKNLMNAYSVGTDPISRATETLAALLYLRGDVAPAKHNISVKLMPDDAFNKSAHLGNTPSDVSKLSLLTGVGLDWQGKAAANNYDAQINFNNPGLRLNKNGLVKQIKPSQNFGLALDDVAKKFTGNLAYKISKVKLIADDRWAARIQSLRDAQLIGATNITNAEQGIYQSDTGEITLNSQQKLMTVITPKTEAIVFDEPKPTNLKQLSILHADSPALVAISATDNQPLANSKRMLLILSTDARNTDMVFDDVAKTTLSDLGKPPVLIRVAKVKLALKTPYKNLLKVFSTNLRGQRQDAINLKQTESSIEFELDISKLTHGATTYFEISV